MQRRHPTPVEGRSTTLILILLLTGCGPLPPGFGDDDGGDDDDGGTTTEQDVAEIDALIVELETHRSELHDGRSQSYLQADGSTLFWIDDSEFDLQVVAWDQNTGDELHYDWSIGDNPANFRFDDDVIVHAVGGNPIEYRVFDRDSENDLIDVLELPAPSDEQRWYAYAAWNGELWLAETEPELNMNRWAPGTSASSRTTEYDLSDNDLGEFWEFGVDGQSLLFVESGRIWRIDRATGQVEWLEHETQVTGTVTFERDGVAWATSDGSLWWRSFTGGTTDITAAIAAADYALNPTFSDADLPTGVEYARLGTKWVYRGSRGLFLFDEAAGTVEPVILDTRASPFITYRYPTLMDDGTLFTEGLTSKTGAGGADGPVYMIEHPSLM